MKRDTLQSNVKGFHVQRDNETTIKILVLIQIGVERFSRHISSVRIWMLAETAVSPCCAFKLTDHNLTSDGAVVLV